MISNEDGVTSLEFDLMADPEHWGEGVEEALLDAVEREARARGIRTIQTWTLHRPDTAGERLSPPTGFGSIPAEDRQTVFMLRSGFTSRAGRAQQRASTCAVRSRSSSGMLAEALEAAGADYRVVTWTSPTPAEYLDGFAYAISRMSTDAPAGGLVIEEQHWDAARVAAP